MKGYKSESRTEYKVNSENSVDHEYIQESFLKSWGDILN